MERKGGGRGNMRIIVVASNKGGTGKTTMSCALARSFARIAPTVMIDADVSSPDVLAVLGIAYNQDTDLNGTFDKDHFLPVSAGENLEVMSSATYLPPGIGTTWTGDMRSGQVREFIERVKWTVKPEYMIVDAPPNSSDELLTILFNTRVSGVVLVTLGGGTSITESTRLVSILQNKAFRIPILGYIRNMVDVFGIGELDGIELLGDVDKVDDDDVGTIHLDHIRDRIVDKLDKRDAVIQEVSHDG